MSHHIPSVSWQQARQILHEEGQQVAPHVKTESLPLLATIGHYLAADIYSVMPVPHYSSSAMDGYAVAGTPSWRLVTPAYPEDSRANIHRLTVPIVPGEATPILTGGLIPEGAEAIVREEHSRLYEGAEGSSRPGMGSHLETQASIHYLDMAEGFEPPAPGADIRHAGAELERGELLARHGDRVSARMAAFLGTNGFDELPVYAPIPVRCAFTGNEVITFGVPAPGQVRDAFGGFMEHAIISAGCEARPSIRLADVESEFRTFLSTSTARVLVFTGGSSTSGVDLVRKVLNDMGATYLFESVDVRPGHPALAARLPVPEKGPNSGRERFVLGLPGNPLAAYTALYSYLPPLLAGMRDMPLPELDSAVLGEPVDTLRKPAGARLLPVSVRDGVAYPLPKSASHMLSSLAAATHCAVLDDSSVRGSAHEVGARVPVIPVL